VLLQRAERADPVDRTRRGLGLRRDERRTIADSVASTPGNAGVPAHTGTLVGGGDWRPGHDTARRGLTGHQRYAQGTSGSLTFDGSSGYVTAGGPVVDTSQSFSVSAWVYLLQTGKYSTAVSNGAFYLQYAKDTNNWAFTLPSDGSNNPAAYYRATANTDNPCSSTPGRT